MLKRLILHVGTEKTGTTSIQAFLSENRQNLEREGWAIPGTLGDRSNRRLAFLCMDEEIVDEFVRRNFLLDPVRRRTAAMRWKASFLAEIDSKPDMNWIVSSEHLSSRLFREEELSRLKDLFAHRFDVIEVLLYIRNPIEATLSLLSTVVKNGGSVGDLPQPGGDIGNQFGFLHVCDHRQTIQRWDRVFPDRVRVRLFARDTFVGGDLLSDFATQCGFSLGSQFVIPSVANESLTNTGVQLFAAINRRLPAFVDDRPSAARGDLQDWMARHFTASAKAKLSPEMVAEYEDAFRESNEWVRARFFPERESLFPSTVAESTVADSNAMDVEAIADLIVELWQAKRRGEGSSRVAGHVRKLIQKLADRVR